MPEPIYSDQYTGPRYRYGCRLRPPGIAAVPPGRIVGADATHPDFPHGTIEYPDPLTGDQCFRYDLTPFPGGINANPAGADLAVVITLRDHLYEIVCWEGGGFAYASVFRAEDAGGGALIDRYLYTYDTQFPEPDTALLLAFHAIVKGASRARRANAAAPRT